MSDFRREKNFKTGKKHSKDSKIKTPTEKDFENKTELIFRMRQDW